MLKLKKIASLVFLLLFVTETFGIYKYVHFCGSEKTSESFFIEKKDCCCDDAEEDDCCTDETSVIQLQKEDAISPSALTKSPENKTFNLAIIEPQLINKINSCTYCKKNLIRQTDFHDSGGTLLNKLCILRI